MSPADARGPLDDVQGASDLCALGRIRTCNLLIRSQMLYPLSYECLFFCLAFAPRSFDPLAATDRTLHDCRRHVKSIDPTPCDLRKRRADQGSDPLGNGRSPGLWGRGFGRGGGGGI